MIEGLYIHIPFCNTKCPYCDFMSFVSEDKSLMDKYIKTLKKELLLHIDNNLKFNLKTIYFGGGTPSLLEPEQINNLIDFIKSNVKCVENLEITVECNPETYRYYEFKLIKEAGVNRISIGNQSFLEKNLKILGRKHKPNHTIEMVDSAFKAGIYNINLDLIYAIPGQTIEDLEKDLYLYTKLPITHISAYMLTVYENTPFKEYIQNNLLTLPDENTSTQMFFLINDYLEDKGFKRYELSNWAKDGFACKHNLFYWTHKQFLGIGVSAWSYVNNERFGNERNFDMYMQILETGKLPIAYKEVVDEEELKKEKIFLGLRTTQGIDKTLIKNTEILNQLENDGYLNIIDDKISLTPKGLMIINQIVSYLI